MAGIWNLPQCFSVSELSCLKNQKDSAQGSIPCIVLAWGGESVVAKELPPANVTLWQSRGLDFSRCNISPCPLNRVRHPSQSHQTLSRGNFIGFLCRTSDPLTILMFGCQSLFNWLRGCWQESSLHCAKMSGGSSLLLCHMDKVGIPLSRAYDKWL